MKSCKSPKDAEQLLGFYDASGTEISNNWYHINALTAWERISWTYRTGANQTELIPRISLTQGKHLYGLMLNEGIAPASVPDWPRAPLRLRFKD